jgi:hypothetical protein
VVSSGSQRAAVLGGVEILFPASSGPPPAVTRLTAALVGAAVDLAWEPAPRADGYRLYRGDLAALRSGGYNHAAAALDGGCYLAVNDASLLADATVPTAFYYLVTAVGPTAEGPAGNDSAGQPRPGGPAVCP